MFLRKSDFGVSPYDVITVVNACLLHNFVVKVEATRFSDDGFPIYNSVFYCINYSLEKMPLNMSSTMRI